MHVPDNNVMDKQYLIQLTLAVYQMSEWWSPNNLLKFKIRNLVDEVLSDFILISYENPGFNIRSRALKNIKTFQQDLKELRAQKLVSRQDFLLFQKEYGRIFLEIEKLSVPEKTKIVKEQREIEKPSLGKLNQRQQKILNILRQKEKVQVWELKEFFLDTSKRTLRRDLEDLLKKALIQRSGKWNKVFYTLSKGVGQDRTQVGTQ